MPRRKQTTYLYRCLVCSREYRSPLRVSEVWCNCTDKVLRARRKPMEFIGQIDTEEKS